MAKNGITYGKLPIKRYRKAKAMRRYRKRKTTNNMKMTITKVPRTVEASQTRVTLMYCINESNVTSSVTQIGNYYTSFLYDVDPDSMTTAMPGFTEYAAFYKRYRVLRVGYKMDFSNREAFAVGVTCYFTNELINFGGTKPMSTIGNPLCKYAIMSGKGGLDKCSIKDSASCVAITGTKQSLYDDLYTGPTDTNTSPGRPLYVNWQASSLNGVDQFTSGNGVAFIHKIYFYVQFYQPRWLKV